MNQIFLYLMVVLQNLVNTCYFNSILQMLLNSKNITSENESWNLIIRKLKNSNNCINLTSIFSFLNWHNFFKFKQPHDAHEAFLKLIEITKCNSFEINLLEFLITETEPYEKQLHKLSQNSLEITAICDTLEECLNNFFKKDIITSWRDTKNINRNLIKYTFLNKTPDKLLILIRQTYEKQTYITFPFVLDISKWLKPTKYYQNSKYLLKSVIIYKCFHYYIYCLQNSQWTLYNDENRTVMNNLDWIRNESPYMLLYEKLH